MLINLSTINVNLSSSFRLSEKRFYYLIQMDFDNFLHLNTSPRVIESQKRNDLKGLKQYIVRRNNFNYLTLKQKKMSIINDVFLLYFQNKKKKININNIDTLDKAIVMMSNDMFNHILERFVLLKNEKLKISIFMTLFHFFPTRWRALLVLSKELNLFQDNLALLLSRDKVKLCLIHYFKTLPMHKDNDGHLSQTIEWLFEHQEISRFFSDLSVLNEIKETNIKSFIFICYHLFSMYNIKDIKEVISLLCSDNTLTSVFAFLDGENVISQSMLNHILTMLFSFSEVSVFFNKHLHIRR